MNLPRRVHGDAAQFLCERHFDPPMTLSVIEKSAGNHYAVLFLQTHRLRAELHLVSQTLLCLPSLVFHRNWTKSTRHRVIPVVLHRVGNTSSPQPLRTQRHRTLYADGASMIGPWQIHSFMQDAAFHSERVVLPDPFDMNQRSLTRTKHHMLERRNGHQIIGFAGHHYTFSMTFTPAGGFPIATV
jgi:hypothetical protein